MSKSKVQRAEAHATAIMKYSSGSSQKTQGLRLINALSAQNGPRKYGVFFFLAALLFWAVPVFCQDDFKYSVSSRRDPFIPLVTPDGRLLKLEAAEGRDSSLALEGIIYDKNGVSYAIVNGSVVKIGDKVSDYQVLKIEERKVVFIKEGQPLEVVLKKEE